MRRLGLKIACAVALLALALVPATAVADSIVYIKDGNVWLAAPDGTRQTQLTTDGGYESPSQADDGTIVAVRRTDENGYHNRRLYRMDRGGHLLNPPVESVPVNASIYIGPLGATVSPDGRRVAYFYFDHGPFGSTDPSVSVSYSTRNTPIGEIADPGPYMNPNWIGNDTLLLFSPPGYQYDVHTDVLGSGQDPVWFGDTNDDLSAGGDVSSDGTRLVAGGGGAHFYAYQLNGPPPALPTASCQFSNPVGSFHTRPNWSPDGRRLTWAEDDGIHVTEVRSIPSCDISDSPAPVIPGADSPFFGPADAPAPAGSNGGGTGTGTNTGTNNTSTGDHTPPAITLTAATKGKLAKILAKGYPVTVGCSEHCVAAGRLLMARKVVAKAVKPGGPGKVKAVLRFSKKTRAQLRRRKTLKLTLLVTAADDAGNVAPVLSKKLALRR